MNAQRRLWILAAGLAAVTGAALVAAAPAPPVADLHQETDVALLEKVAGSMAEANKLNFDGRQAYWTDCRDAYIRLGRIGTPEALAAIGRLEETARKRAAVPVRASLKDWVGKWERVSSADLLGQTVTKDGTTYGLIDDAVGGYPGRVALATTRKPKDPDSWTRPLRLYPNINDKFLKVDVKIQDRRLELAADEKILVYSCQVGGQWQEAGKWPLPDLRDTDDDGLPDFQEVWLGLDPRKADTDGDGIADGQDASPDYAPDKKEAGDEEVAILQKAFFALFSFREGQQVFVLQEGRPVQLWGFRGMLLVKHNPDAGGSARGRCHFLTWKADKADAEARVTILETDKRLAHDFYTLGLKKIGKEWYVVSLSVIARE
jgi:hypothetical protein